MNIPKTLRNHISLVSLFAALSAQAASLPANLPTPDPADKGSKNKPVKVYILSGQSNMLGFGKIENADPYYSSVFLSGDPSVKTSTIFYNRENIAMVPIGIYQTAEKDSPRGGLIRGLENNSFDLGVTETVLPQGNRPLIVDAYVEVPFSGEFRIHAHETAAIKIDGAATGEESGTVVLKKGQRYPIEISYPKGGVSAALWMEKTNLKGIGDLRWAVEELGRFPYLLDDSAEWTVRNDVMLNDAYMGKGASAPLSTTATGKAFGPELGFGYVMGAFHDEPVIVMKADIGNRSLGWDILPPGTDSWEYEGKYYPGYGMRLNDDGKPVKAKEGEWYAGKQYDEYTEAIRNVLDNFDERYPEYADQGFEVAGFVWWQGHKDGPNPGHRAFYEKNLVNLIKAWRKEFDAPNAKWAIATVGFEGINMKEHYVKIAESQMAVADPERHPELAGTVKTIDTRPFWRPAVISPMNQGYHYNHNAVTYMLTGDALGRAMAELYGAEVEYPSAVMNENFSYVPEYPVANDGIMMALQPALRPIVMDKLIPEYVAEAPGVPAYRRGGIPIENIVGGIKTEKPTANLRTQYDRLLNLYELAGVDDYLWKPSGPEMQLAKWHYLSFDPPEKKTDSKGDRYREITLPQKTENWLSADFNPPSAGWNTGKGPFGQREGKQDALSAGCSVAHCGCSNTPNTLWEKEVLLLRQSFQFPEFESGKRYRLIVGGAGHPWSGEGFALYLNGEMVSELTGGGYKNGGFPRGVYLFDDLAEEVSGKEVTIGLKAFLRQNHHKNKPAPPSGHISIWLEEALLPSVVDSIPLEN